MLIKKFLHWLCFFTVLGSFTLLTVQGADLSAITSIKEAFAQEGGPVIENGDILVKFSPSRNSMHSVLRAQFEEQVCHIKKQLFEQMAYQFIGVPESDEVVGEAQVRILRPTVNVQELLEFLEKLQSGEINCVRVSFHQFLLPFFHGGVS